MLSLVGLYQRAEHNGISVDDFPLKKRAALAVLDNIGHRQAQAGKPRR